MTLAAHGEAPGTGRADRIVRHAGADRALHWLAAAAVLTLLFSAFLPIVGVDFAWVAIHWSAGLALTVIVVAHVLRARLKGSLGAIMIGRRDLGDAAAIARAAFRRGGAPLAKPAKYSFAQKLIHLAFALVVLAGVATGLVMMVKIDTPWWDRNPYWLSGTQWGIVYVVHGLAALLLVTMIMTHVYFALRPEKLHFLRSMVLGWITRREFEAGHDPQRWQVDER